MLEYIVTFYVVRWNDFKRETRVLLLVASHADVLRGSSRFPAPLTSAEPKWTRFACTNVIYGDKWQKTFEYAGQMWSSTGSGFRPYLVHVVYERSTLVDYIFRYVYVCWRRYGFLHRLLARRTKWPGKCEVMLLSKARLMGPRAARHSYWQGRDQTSGCYRRSQSELDTSSARSR